MQALSMDQALSIILNVFKHGAELKAHALAAIVLDAGGRVKAFLKQDGASLMRFEIALAQLAWVLPIAVAGVHRRADREPRDQPAAGDAVDHRELFCDARGRVVQRDASAAPSCSPLFVSPRGRQ